MCWGHFFAYHTVEGERCSTFSFTFKAMAWHASAPWLLNFFIRMADPQIFMGTHVLATFSSSSSQHQGNGALPRGGGVGDSPAASTTLSSITLTPQSSPRSIVLTSRECWLLTAHICPFVWRTVLCPSVEILPGAFYPSRGSASQTVWMTDMGGQKACSLGGNSEGQFMLQRPL